MPKVLLKSPVLDKMCSPQDLYIIPNMPLQKIVLPIVGCNDFLFNICWSSMELVDIMEKRLFAKNVT